MRVMILAGGEQVLALPPFHGPLCTAARLRRRKAVLCETPPPPPFPREGGHKRPPAGKLVSYPPGPLSGKGGD